MIIGEILILSLIAGSATGVDGLFVASQERISNRFIAGSMGFASGIMLLVSFLNLFVESLDLASYSKCFSSLRHWIHHRDKH